MWHGSDSEEIPSTFQNRLCLCSTALFVLGMAAHHYIQSPFYISDVLDIKMPVFRSV